MKFKNYENKSIGKYQALPSDMVSGDFYEALYTSAYPKSVSKEDFNFKKDKHAIEIIKQWKQALKTTNGGRSIIPRFNPNKISTIGGGGSSDIGSTGCSKVPRSKSSSSSSITIANKGGNRIMTKDEHEHLQKALKMNLRVIGGGGSCGTSSKDKVTAAVSLGSKKSYKNVTISQMSGGGGGYKGLVMKGGDSGAALPRFGKVLPAVLSIGKLAKEKEEKEEKEKEEKEEKEKEEKEKVEKKLTPLSLVDIYKQKIYDTMVIYHNNSTEPKANYAIAFAALKYLDPDLYEIELKETSEMIKFDKLISIVKNINILTPGSKNTQRGGANVPPPQIHRGQYELDTRVNSALEALKKLRFIDPKELHDRRTIHYNFYKTVAEYNRRTEGSLVKKETSAFPTSFEKIAKLFSIGMLLSSIPSLYYQYLAPIAPITGVVREGNNNITVKDIAMKVTKQIVQYTIDNNLSLPAETFEGDPFYKFHMESMNKIDDIVNKTIQDCYASSNKQENAEKNATKAEEEALAKAAEEEALAVTAKKAKKAKKPAEREATKPAEEARKATVEEAVEEAERNVAKKDLDLTKIVQGEESVTTKSKPEEQQQEKIKQSVFDYLFKKNSIKSIFDVSHITSANHPQTTTRDPFYIHHTNAEFLRANNLRIPLTKDFVFDVFQSDGEVQLSNDIRSVASELTAGNVGQEINNAIDLGQIKSIIFNNPEKKDLFIPKHVIVKSFLKANIKKQTGVPFDPRDYTKPRRLGMMMEEEPEPIRMNLNAKT